jgi:hypothetical protein
MVHVLISREHRSAAGYDVSSVEAGPHVDEIAQAVGAALNRGCSGVERMFRKPLLSWIPIFGLVLIIGTAIEVLSPAHQTWFVVWPACAAVTLVAFWLLPKAEIAEPGKSRYSRFTQVLATITIGLVGAGLARTIFY